MALLVQITLRQFDKEELKSDEEDKDSTSSDGYGSFNNMFSKDKRPTKPGYSKYHKNSHRDKLPKHAMPKLNFPLFDGTDPRIWLDDCLSYFDMYKLPEGMWITSATLHMRDNASNGIRHKSKLTPSRPRRIFLRS